MAGELVQQAHDPPGLPGIGQRRGDGLLGGLGGSVVDGATAPVNQGEEGPAAVGGGRGGLQEAAFPSP
ncbi:hypothetical protein ACF061_26920 [Streptomyces sp. NPDC015220]|uniref:hypothetical protein n=1 Tax=Streptomyces sp. NPDC015220 TaxID=3364947 RepID=UPI0036F74740